MSIYCHEILQGNGGHNNKKERMMELAADYEQPTTHPVLNPNDPAPSPSP